MDAFFHRRLAGSRIVDEMIATMRGTPPEDDSPSLTCQCGNTIEISGATESPEFPGNWRFVLNCQKCSQEMAFWGQASRSDDGRFHARISPDVDGMATAPYELRFHSREA